MTWVPLTQAQAPAPNDAARAVLLARGKVLLTQVKGEPASDAIIFRQVGGDVAQQLLQEVANQGLKTTATIDDWADMHRAYYGLTALEVFRNNPAKAGAYAFFNNAFYRSKERNYEAGLACLRQALELDKQAGQPLYLVYQAMGEDLRSLGRLPEAMDAFHQAESILPDLTDKTAADMERDMVGTLLSQGKRKEAERLAEQMSQRATAAPPIYQAQALLAQADLLFAAARYADGIQAVKNALTAVAKTPDALLLSYEATAQLSGAVLDGISTLPYSEALQMARLADTQIPGLPIQLAPFAQTAIRERRRLAGDLDGLLREDVLRVEQARQTGNAAELVASLKFLANTYASVNETRQRALTLEEAVDIQKKTFPASGLPDDVVAQRAYLNLLNTLGQAYLNLREAGPARRNFDEVVKTIGSLSTASTLASLRPVREQALMGKADALALDDDPDGARSMLQQLLLSAGSDDGPYILLELGRLERTLNEKPEAAVEYYERAIPALRGARDYPQELAARLTLVRYLALKAAGHVAGARQKALDQLAASEALTRGMQYADAEWRLDYLKGVLAEYDNAKLAIAHYERAIAKLDELRSGLSQQEQRQTFLDNESVQDLYSRLTALLSHAGLRADAWRYMERAKARNFLDALQGRRFAPDSDAGRPDTVDAPPAIAELAKLEKRIADVRFQLLPQNEEMLRAAGREPAILKRGLSDLEARFTLARDEASLLQSRSGQVLSLQPVPLARIQKSIGPHTVLVEYALLEGELTAFVVTRTCADQLIWKGDTTKLRRDVLRLRALLADPQSTEWPALLEQVSKTVITPVAAKIPQGTQQILIVPAGYLNYLPFPVLSLPDGRTLVEAFAVSYLPNASALCYLGNGTQMGGELFLGALGAVAVDGMPPLPGTLAETAGIAATYPKAQRVSGAAFTHDAAQHALLTADTVHFATHGLLEEEAPLFSALLTSPAAGKPSRLSLYEVAGMRIRARLVVLSACETGLGTLQRGDEITGLTRTFLTAGADTVLASLWKVSDESTAVLMQQFYRGLAHGLKPAAALREAALAVRAKYPHPFYWAAFVVTGRN
jgi:CHAT domain-containing protein